MYTNFTIHKYTCILIISRKKEIRKSGLITGISVKICVTLFSVDWEISEKELNVNFFLQIPTNQSRFFSFFEEQVKTSY